MSRVLGLIIALAPIASLAVETMRIHMGDVREEVSLSAEELAFSLDEADAVFTALPRGRVTVRFNDGRIEIDGAPWPAAAIRFRAGEAARDAGVPGELPVRAGATEVRGDVIIRVSGSKLQLINVIPLEAYLAAVLGSEMPNTFPEEALKAQAVAARTYALQRKLDGYDQPYHLGSSVLHQVYGGVSEEDPRTRAAVAATRGEVLTWDLQPIEAYFHASCGGRTESGSRALGRELPYLMSVSCPCQFEPSARWAAILTESDLTKAFGTDVNASELEVEARTRTDRVDRLRAGRRSVDAVSFRRRLGYARIKSLAFDIHPAGEGGIRIAGRGHGHGAGLCQWGARMLALDGRSYREILAHYYPGTELQILY
jgi:stage II sporulation protein D